MYPLTFARKREYTFARGLIILTLLTVFFFCDWAVADVKVREDMLTIPTYVVDPPNPMPRFYEGRSHQGVQRRMYPYPMNDQLTRIKEDRDYHIIYVENDFIELGIMPCMGGRIFYAEDKTNDYVWFYRQHVIKPSLIGMLGFWISGSNAWGFPHHHGPNTVRGMDYRVVENRDGSKTIWIANTDRLHRMRILVGYTVYPDSSLVEMTIRPMNPTPIVNSFLFWANPSVHVNEDYQVIFPPSVQYVTHHAKREMTTWPVSDRRFNDFDYENVDVSLWKNVGVPTSFFSWDPKEDYFGGYDHGKQAGTVWVGNHHVAPGMKYWAWGNNPGGDRSNAGLTDDDGHYIELMAGAYTDNQPDYSWLQPYEVKETTMIWFPIRELGGIKYANRYGALNLEIVDGVAEIRMNATASHKKTRVFLKAGGRSLFEDTIDIDPATPYAVDAPLKAGVSEDDLVLSLVANDGETIMRYAPVEHHPQDVPIPDALRPPPNPEDIETVEELYYTGLRLNQFYNANIDPIPYYEEGLKRDPGDYRTNTQLGILALKAKNWDKAEKHLRAAVDRITARYTRARDGEAEYYLGVSLRMQGHLNESYDKFYRAVWNAGWHTPGYYQLAELDCIRGDYDIALDHIDRAISTNTELLVALNLRTVILRKLGNMDDAIEQAEAILEKDCLNQHALNELSLLKKGRAGRHAADERRAIMRDETQSYLELAAQYLSMGCFQEALNLVSERIDAGDTFPMLYYYQGYCRTMLNDVSGAEKSFAKAAKMPSIYCFPFRAESVWALRQAMELNRDDALAPYYLGNLYYEGWPEKAVQLWEESIAMDDSFYIAHRNLAIAALDMNEDVDAALAHLKHAIELNSGNPRLLYEMDELYTRSGAPPETKYRLLSENRETAQQRSETLLRLATRALEVGQYKEALDIISNNYFPQFEGDEELQDAYLNAFILRGITRFDEGEYAEAIEDFTMARDYPVERFGRTRWAQIHYLLGTCHDALGDDAAARVAYESALEVNVQRGEYLYYHGMALARLGRAEDATTKLEELLEQSRGRGDSDFFRQFAGGRSRSVQEANNHYLAGLAYKGLGKLEDARREFDAALELNPAHIWAREHRKR